MNLNEWQNAPPPRSPLRPARPGDRANDTPRARSAEGLGSASPHWRRSLAARPGPVRDPSMQGVAFEGSDTDDRHHRHALAHPFCFSQRIIKSYSFFPAVGGSGLGRAPHPHRCHSDHTLRAGRGFLLRCIAWATTLSLRHRNQHNRTTTCPHTGCHVSTIYFPHPPIAPLNILFPQKPQRISPLIARR
jgi:hypothetical protein